MAFGFFKKALGFVGKVAGIAGKVASVVPGVGGLGGTLLKAGGGLLRKAAGGSGLKAINTVLQVRQGNNPILAQLLGGQSVQSAALLSKQSSVMPGGAVAAAGGVKALSKARSISKGIAKSKRKKRGRMQTYYRAGRRIKRRRGPSLSRAQLAAGFGGRRRMRRR